MPITLPLTTRRAWMVTVSLVAIFTPLTLIDALAADAEPVSFEPQLVSVSAPVPSGTTTTESLEEPETTTTAAPETTTTLAPETTTTAAPETTTTTAAPTTTAVPETTAPAPPPAPEPEPEVVAAPAAPASGVWHTLAQCETGGNWSLQVRSFGGGLMIHQGTWEAMGGTEFAALPSQASMSAQITVAERIREATGGGYSAWPGCQRKLGLP